jgi:phosphate binding protein
MIAPLHPDEGTGFNPPDDLVMALMVAAYDVSDPEPGGAEAQADLLRSTLPAILGPAERYEIRALIGRGGMGDIYEAYDRQLDRLVAIKVLQVRHQGNPTLMRHFVREAQISSQLQHPGIVPVHELGQLADGRPFLAMKRVYGQTLATLLRSSDEQLPDTRRLLAIFQQVCQTLAYAHAAGVLHRDLKSANVMVGAFDEVQVMDWGLSKLLDDGGATDDADLDPAGPATTDPDVSPMLPCPQSADAGSHRGEVKGTVAYMAPEQANGEVEQVDERCDVFGLGAILCEILTGKPPYVGTTEEVLRQAKAGDLQAMQARLNACGAEEDLRCLVERCLAPALEDRPRNAGEVARAMAAYLASVDQRLREAEVAKAAAQARAEEDSKARTAAQAQAIAEREARTAAQRQVVAERQARRLTVALAASLLGLVLLAGGGWLWVERLVEARTTRQIKDDLDEARGLLGRFEDVWLVEDPAEWRKLLAIKGRVEEGLNTGEVAEEIQRQARGFVADVQSLERDRSWLRGFLAASVLPDYKSGKALSGTVRSAGSDTMKNLMLAWAEGFRETHPHVHFVTDSEGSKTAPPALLDQKTHFGPMSRPMEEKEIELFVKKFGYQPTAVPIAVDMIAVYVHKANPLSHLTLQQLAAIYAQRPRADGAEKEIHTWGDLGLAGEWFVQPVLPFGRNDASGTRAFFRKHVLRDAYKASVLERPDSASVVQAVAHHKFALGYSGIGYKTADVKPIPLKTDAQAEPVAATPENAYSGKYPLARNLYLYVNRDPTKPLDPLEREFLRYVLSKQGQLEVYKNGYLPIPAKIAAEARDSLGLDPAHSGLNE